MSYADELPPEAVTAHDLARDLPEDAWAVVIDRLVAHLDANARAGARPGARCVDVGVGSGAVGGRVAARGIDVVGVDCNASMLASLHRTYPDVAAVLGDAEALPLPAACADLVVLACVLHLVDDWRGALREVVRVAAPGAVAAVNLGASGLAGRTGVSRTFADALTSRVEVPPMPGPQSSREIDAELVALGCRSLGRVDASTRVQRTIRDHVFRLEWNPFAWPPALPREALAEAGEVTRAWALDAFGTIDEPNETDVVVGFSTFRVP